jgi:hypothetical protein
VAALQTLLQFLAEPVQDLVGQMGRQFQWFTDHQAEQQQ